jgi:hypothetical protein
VKLACIVEGQVHREGLIVVKPPAIESSSQSAAGRFGDWQTFRCAYDDASLNQAWSAKL